MPVLQYPDLTHIPPYVPFVAFMTCKKVMDVGAKKHPRHSWVIEQPDNHAHKAARHALTHVMQLRGESKPDGENHSHMACCRAAMLVAQQEAQEDPTDLVCGV